MLGTSFLWRTPGNAKDVGNVSLHRGLKMKVRKLLSSLFAAGLFAFGAAAPASAQPVVTGGVINITIVDLIDGDVLSNNNVGVGVAANVAANVCPALDLNAAVLARQFVAGGDDEITCTVGDQQITFAPVQRQG
jgi:hypothetical protein